MSLYKYVGPLRLANGYASKFEQGLAEQLDKAGVEFKYEPYTISYNVPARKSTYKPDFVLPNGILIEAKGGHFEAKDRQKMIYVKESNPHLDIRFVFSKPNTKLYKGSTTTYAKWAEDHGFPWSEKRIPQEWISSKTQLVCKQTTKK